MDSLIATARSNKVATMLGIQDASQLRKDYGKEQANVIMIIVGNVFSGQVMRDPAKQLSDCFVKIMQDRTSFSINQTDTSISRPKLFDAAIPASKISGLSSGEFVGMVDDDPQQKIELKTFHCEIINDHKALQQEQESYQEIPVFRTPDNFVVQRNYLQIKEDVKDIVTYEIDRILHDPALEHLGSSKGKRWLRRGWLR